MLKILLAVETCAKYHSRRVAQRRTWLKHLPDGLDWKYFVGKTEQLVNEPDIVRLYCGDGYNDLIQKTRMVIRWAVQGGYDYLFKTDDDTYVDATKLLASGFEQHDYVGWSRQRTYAQGGSGYWLSRKAMLKITHDTDPTPETLAEDQHIGAVLARHEIYPVHDGRYLVGPSPKWDGWPTRSARNDIITLHKLMPLTMDEAHAHWLST